ncbi:MAG: hypothetical protein QOE54_2850, partial [Streptosporangiaceae bacterium]|nr:hypothetical protein [Streptosporangiaceae bacterium]
MTVTPPAHIESSDLSPMRPVAAEAIEGRGPWQLAWVRLRR